MSRKKKVFIGLSGGVDSSLSAYLLKKDGYQVIGVYMKNWTEDIGHFQCSWREDYLSAKRLAAFLEIEFLSLDFQKEYKRFVVDHMIGEYEAGRTPNPDIRCNQMIKFDLFYHRALSEGADLIATGHYALIRGGRLYQAADQTKDQTYFLYRLPVEVLKKTIFPLGSWHKKDVRRLAQKINLPNAFQPESMGICFVGEVGLKDFLSRYVETSSGDIMDEQGRVLGRHQGAIFYTLGQRQGLDLGGGLAYYVIGKNMILNQVYVSQNLNHPKLWTKELHLRDCHWLTAPAIKKAYYLRCRHGAPLIKAQCLSLAKDTSLWSLESELKIPASGQSVVVYDRCQQVLGGGILI